MKECPSLLYIMLKNVYITLQLNYKTLQLHVFCTTLDYEHSCIDLAEYCEYCRKDSILRQGNVSSFVIMHGYPCEG